MKTTINMLAIDLAKGSFQVCTVKAGGTSEQRCFCKEISVGFRGPDLK